MHRDRRDPVLLVHGLIGHMRDADMENAIAAPVFAPDLLGYGERTAAEATLPAQVEFLRAYLDDAANGKRVHLVGHSIGGAIAFLLAHAYPDIVHSIISVEGNFTLKDAFWSSAIARMNAEEVDRALARDRADPAGWLGRSGVSVTTSRLTAAASHLRNQSAFTVRSMARSVVEITGSPAYLEKARAVLDRGIPVHLVAGERSMNDWDVPAFVMERAASANTVPDCGHLVTIEQPELFGRLVHRLTR